MVPGGVRWIEYPSKGSEVHLYWTGDWHVGNYACALEHLQKDLDEIQSDPYAFWLGGGDYTDCISVDDRRFDPEVVSPDISVRDLGRLGYVLAERVRDLMRPVAHKCLGLLYGNHEAKYMRCKDAQMLHAWLCTELKVPDMGYSAIFDIRFRRYPRRPPTLVRTMAERKDRQYEGANTWTLRTFAHHGAGAAQTPGGKLNTLRRAMDFFPMAQLTLLAHVHEQKIEPSTVLDGDKNCEHIVALERRGAISGTYLRTYAEGPATYGEMKLYRPVPLGMTEIIFWPADHKFKVMV